MDPVDVTNTNDKFKYENYFKQIWEGKGDAGEKIRKYVSPGTFTRFSWFRDFPFAQGEYGECVKESKRIVKALDAVIAKSHCKTMKEKCKYIKYS